MKIQLEESEMNYVANLLKSVAHSMKSFKETHDRVLRLSNKFEPPRSYVELSTGERTSVNSILYNGIKTVEKQKAAFTEATPADQKEHINRVESLLVTVYDKLKAEGAKTNDTPQV